LSEGHADPDQGALRRAHDAEIGLGANTGRVDVHLAGTFEALRRLVEGTGQMLETTGTRSSRAASTVL
jgi:hypothetical protein